MAGYGIRVSVFFGALFLIYGVHLPYLPLWLEWRGLSPAEIGVVTSAPFFLRLIATPAIAYSADRRGAHAQTILLLAWTGLVAALVLSQADGFWPILVIALILAIAVTTIMPLTETVAIGGVRQGLDYGRMRLWGSLTFIAASFAGGAAVDVGGRGIGIWLIVAGCAATVAAAYLLPADAGKSGRGRRARARAQASALEPPLSPVPPRRGIDRATVVRLARHPLFITFLVAIGTVQAAHAMFYTFGAIHWRAGGLSSAWIGTLWAIGVITEVSLFAVSGRLVGWLGPVRLMLLGAGAAVLRCAQRAGIGCRRRDDRANRRHPHADRLVHRRRSLPRLDGDALPRTARLRPRDPRVRCRGGANGGVRATRPWHFRRTAGIAQPAMRSPPDAASTSRPSISGDSTTAS